MSLADHFPQSYKDDFAARNIDIGSAILVSVPEFNINYDKFAIYYANDSTNVELCGILVINTPTNIILKNPIISKQHVLIDSRRHDFLDYDSYVDCTQIRSRSINELVQCIMDDPTRLKGNVHPDILTNIFNTLLASELISARDKQRYSIF